MKKWISVLLCLMLIFTCAAPCFASEIVTFDATTSLIPSGAKAPTQEEILASQEDYDSTLLTKEFNNKERAAWHSLAVTYYGQEKNMSCGQACVKMALKYLTGTTYAESTIRNNTNYGAHSDGTMLIELVPYLNEESNSDYARYYGGSRDYIMNGILTSIMEKSAPPICGIQSQQAYGFPYNGSGGHYILINQTATDGSAVNVLDPWAGYINDTANKSYNVSMSNLFAAYCLRYIGIGFVLY